MSTEHQQYSIDNQSQVISAYAKSHQMEVVRTYADSGKSGLTLRHRDGLRQLLEDTESGTADFSVILVYDISRWGRFQDSDESAYYEYRCRKAKIEIHYCAELFANDGSISSTLLKAIKRAMAAEYSRELSVKVFAGKCRLIELGFRQGGGAGFGLRRLLVDEHRNPKGILSPGEQKNLITDRVLLVPGPVEEIELVREVFRIFTEQQTAPAAIACILNERCILSEHGRPWTRFMICDMVTNPKYVGANVSNRTSFKLRKRIVKNPPEMWVRRENAFPAIIDAKTFNKAQFITADRSRRYTNPELQTALDALLKQKGRLSLSILRESPDVPSPDVYQKHYGGLLAAYRAIGYIPKGDFSYIDRARQLLTIRQRLLSEFVKDLVAAGAKVKRVNGGHTFAINNEFTLMLKMARCIEFTDGIPQWVIRLNRRANVDMTAIARMAPGNESVLDFYIIPRVHDFQEATRVSSENGFHIDAYRFSDLSFLIKLARKVKLEDRV